MVESHWRLQPHCHSLTPHVADISGTHLDNAGLVAFNILGVLSKTCDCATLFAVSTTPAKWQTRLLTRRLDLRSDLMLKWPSRMMQVGLHSN